MKPFLFIPVLVCVCACANSSLTQPKQPLDQECLARLVNSNADCSRQGDYDNLPNTTAVSIGNETQTTPREVLEERYYEASLIQIQQRLIDESAKLQRGEIARTDVCAIDTLVDSRGGRHFKPYCGSR